MNGSGERTVRSKICSIPDGAFRIYLDNFMQQLLEGGYAVTNDFDAIDVISTNASASPRGLRRPLRRGRPDG